MQDPLPPAPAKKRRRRRKEARPSEIIDAAMTLWSEKGFAATKLDDVARAAGVAKGTIYLYFDSKEALFQSAMEDRLVATITEVGAMGAAFEGTTEDLLRHVFATVLRQVSEGGGIVFTKVLIAEGHRFPALTQQYRSIVLERGMGVIRGVLARGAARGELRADAAEIDPRLIMSPLVMSALWQSIFAEAEGDGTGPGGVVQGEDLIAQLMRLILDGLTPRP